MIRCCDPHILCSSPIVDAIRSGIDVLVGTPGRIKDHLQNQKLDLSKLKHVVLDEVDSMLDMGFAEQVEEILATSYKPGEILDLIFFFLEKGSGF